MKRVTNLLAKITYRLTSFLLLVVLTALPTSLFAAWQVKSFATGSFKHHIAAAGTNRHNAELDLFCDNFDTRIAAALYLPDQRFMQREIIKVNMRVDKQQLWSFDAMRHSMSVVIPEVPEQLLIQLAKGNRVLITYPVAKNKNKTEQFTLRSSAKTLSSLKSNCSSL
ncbi:hypothetical protein M3P05_12290 [Sansalvadorimonas sp. 2012CJ34-2]|uniref:Uncharacterized protein n=1 Tax=Parendozoicomonas callyspongiae TaxID=2942213 RepID=A0ABT0PJQ9_9GAMM|nr:hypothetical protein [Sansalvadorimonas sp. 2012CJ34-2]MCL6270703.1 hypothetical protein [Sansalvadorimonas sp. 2012CJ34-2]